MEAFCKIEGSSHTCSGPLHLCITAAFFGSGRKPPLRTLGCTASRPPAMGSNKKKRKSVGPADEQPLKRSSSSQPGRRSTGGGGGGGGGGAHPAMAWSADGVTITLPASQAVVFLGRATLTVESGEVLAFGSMLTPDTGAVEVAADDRCGGALLLEPGAAAGTVPLAASGAVVLRLARAPGGGAAAGPPATPQGTSKQQPQRQQQQQQQQQGDASDSRRQLGFDAWLTCDPAAAPPPLPPLWQQAAGEVEGSLAEGSQPPLIVVGGAKKVGKSTFCRYLINSLLARHGCVAYLDTGAACAVLWLRVPYAALRACGSAPRVHVCVLVRLPLHIAPHLPPACCADCGQPEFTAPGLVSLNLVTAPVLGPPHLHPRRPAAAFFVGDTSPANDPVRYLQYVRELFSWYSRHGTAAAAAAAGGAAQRQRQGADGAPRLPPLVVNTHGWVKGMGFDVLLELLQGLPVSHMVQIAAANPKKNLPPGTFWLAHDSVEGTARGGEVLHWLLPGLGGDAAAQPAASETSARSGGGASGPAAAEGGGGGRGRLHAVEQRALQWEALAQQCIGNCSLAPAPTPRRGTPAAVGPPRELGDLLAAAVPFEVDVEDVEVQASGAGWRRPAGVCEWRQLCVCVHTGRSAVLPVPHPCRCSTRQCPRASCTVPSMGQW